MTQGVDDDGSTARRALRAAFVDERDGPLPTMLLALTVLAGVVDATSILALDHVFVATMTGNVVILGLGLSGAAGFSVSSSLLALAGFLVGVLLAVSMGGQLALIRHLKVPDLLTVVLTLTMTGMLTERGRGPRDPAVLRRGLALVAFAVGVVAGGLLIRLVSVGAALLLGLVIILAVGLGTHRVSRAPAPWSGPR